MKYLLLIILMSCGDLVSSLGKRNLSGSIDPVDPSTPVDPPSSAFTIFAANKSGIEAIYRVTESGQISLATTLPAGTTLSSKVFFNNRFYLGLNDFNGQNGELYVLEGTNLRKVKDLHSAGSSNPKYLTVYKGSLYFSAKDASKGRELHKMTTSEVVSVVSDLQSGSVGANPTQLTVAGDRLYFAASTSSQGNELFSFNGSSTSIVKDNVSGARDTFPRFLVSKGDDLYFSGLTNGTSRSSYQSHLYKVTGTSMSLVDTTDLDIMFLHVKDDDLYANCRGSAGAELCKLNGSALNMISDINGDSTSSKPTYITEFNGKLYFSAYTKAQGFELWSYDLSSGQKSLVKDLYSGKMSSWPKALHAYGDYLYFSANDNQKGHELWRVSKSGTVELALDSFVGAGSSHPHFAKGFYHY